MNPDVKTPAGKPLYVPHDTHPSVLSSVVVLIPIFLSALGLLIVLLGGWTNPYFLLLGAVAPLYSIYLGLRVVLCRVKHAPIMPSWVASIVVLTIYLAPATGILGFVRLFNRHTGMFDKALRDVSTSARDAKVLNLIDPTVDTVSAVLLWICGSAFLLGCAMIWLEVVALRQRLVDIEDSLIQTQKAV